MLFAWILSLGLNKKKSAKTLRGILRPPARFLFLPLFYFWLGKIPLFFLSSFFPIFSALSSSFSVTWNVCFLLFLSDSWKNLKHLLVIILHIVSSILGVSKLLKMYLLDPLNFLYFPPLRQTNQFLFVSQRCARPLPCILWKQNMSCILLQGQKCTNVYSCFITPVFPLNALATSLSVISAQYLLSQSYLHIICLVVDFMKASKAWPRFSRSASYLLQHSLSLKPLCFSI